jgi:protein-S-isoprenylcysteine O-methyltransferase Ste14
VAELALGLWALFGVVAVVGRVLLHLRRTGSTGLRGVSGARGSPEWLGGMAFLAAIGLGVGGPLLDLAGWIDPREAIDGPAAHVTGLVLYTLGLAGLLWSQLTMGASWRIGVDESERTALVTAGPFRVVRNPIFTTMAFMWTGLALLVPNLLTLASVVLLVIALELQTRLVEEPYLTRIHGDEYLRWASRAGRFFPGLGRLG